MARGVWDKETQPIMIILNKKLNLSERTKPTFAIMGLNDEMIELLDKKVSYSNGFVINEPNNDPILWEQMIEEKDKYFVETNMFLSMLDSHTNLSLMTSIDQAIPVEDYLTDYITKMSATEMSLIASTMLAAMNFCEEHKSKADDADSEIRKCKYFAARTITSFQGKMQHEMRTMIAALMGLKSDLSSEKFHYVFPHSFLNYLEGVSNDDYYSDEDNNSIESSLCNSINDEEGKSNTCIEQELENIEKNIKDTNADSEGKTRSSGARYFKIDDDNIVFLTQVE